MKKLIILIAVVLSHATLRAQVEDLVIVKDSGGDVSSARVKGPVIAQNVRREVRERGGFGGGYAGGMSFLQNGPVPSKSLVIINSKNEPKVLKEMSEDLAVMAKILEDNLPEEVRRDPMRKVLGINIITQDGQNARNFYIEDYGAVFFMNVSTPLLPAEQADSEKNKKDEPEDTAWEEARQELFGPRRAARTQWKVDGGRSQEYKEESVENLKRSCIASLRNATNLRHLKGDDYVTVVISGPVVSATPDESRGEHFELHGGAEDVFVWNSSTADQGRATMVIRAKKSDIDEAARKKEEPTVLKDKVSVLIY